MAEEPYIPEEFIGVGPSAKIYRAHEQEGNRSVRLKVLLTEHESPFFLDRAHLAHRVAALKQICHPQVARFIELDVQEQDMTLVSEFAEGMNGWDWSRLETVTVAHLRTLAMQLLAALQAGEVLKLPHGDVKPANLIVENHPVFGLRLVLQDWGVGQSRHAQPKDTLRFRAPELAPGDEPTARSDLYSAGATLAALIATLPTHSDPFLHRWLAWLMQTNPARRPVSATQALAALKQGSGLPTPRSPWQWALLLGYNLGVLAVLAQYVHWLWWRGR